MRSSTTSTSRDPLSTRSASSPSCARPSRDMPTSRYTSVRHARGTAQGRNPRDSSRCSPRRTPRTRAGQGTGPSKRPSKAWWSWAAPLAAATSSPRSSPNDCRSRTACCHGSLGCLNCSPRGSSCSTAQHPAARTYYEPCRRQTPQSSLPSTMLPSGAAWQHCWRAGMATCRCQTSATAAPNSH